MGVPPNGCFIREHPTEMDDDKGCPYSRKPPNIDLKLESGTKKPINMGCENKNKSFAVLKRAFLSVRCEFLRSSAPGYHQSTHGEAIGFCMMGPTPTNNSSHDMKS